MRIHADHLNLSDIYAAARIARVDIVTDGPIVRGSRTRAQGFEVKLEGESRRRPNGGASGAGAGYAATWDQWGVFLSILFDRDETVTIPRVYADRAEFDYRTGTRFADGWPTDAHGDHTFRYAGPAAQQCTKCSAVQRWPYCP